MCPKCNRTGSCSKRLLHNILNITLPVTVQKPMRSLANTVRRKNPGLTAEILDLCDKKERTEKEKIRT